MEIRKIIEGVWNSWFPSAYVKRVATRRRKICESNVCGMYDALGVTEKVILRGRPACGQCGCNIAYKTHSLSSHCALKELGLTPLWEAEMTEDEEQDFEHRTGIVNHHE